MLARYFLLKADDEWLVTLEGRVMGRFPSRTEATEAAIVMADLMVAMHHDADVMVSEDGRLILAWTADPDRSVKRRVAPGPSPALGHVEHIQHGGAAQ